MPRRDFAFKTLNKHANSFQTHHASIEFANCGGGGGGGGGCALNPRRFFVCFSPRKLALSRTSAHEEDLQRPLYLPAQAKMCRVAAPTSPLGVGVGGGV